MPISLTTVTHGPAALDALAAAVRSAKGGDPLAPVAVIVPTNTAGVMARRALGRRGGAAAIDVLTLYRVAELLGAPSLLADGRKPVSTPVVDLALKQVIHDVPGIYREVNHHPSTVVALRDLYRELRIAGPTSLTGLARTQRGSEPARVAEELSRRLAPAWYDEGDLMARATDEARRALPPRLARIVVQLPERVRPLELALLTALGAAGSVELVVGLTGDDGADAAVRELVAQLTGAACPPLADDASPPAHGAHGDVEIVSTTDADDEVRIAVRAVLDGARRGVRFDRMAVLWPTDRPYARMVEHQLTAAGVPWNGRPGTAVTERMVPRVLAELLELDKRGLRRTALMTLLADVPARRPGGGPVPTARWERIGRRAGIVREEDWNTHLARFIAAAREPDAPTARDADAAESLLAFVDDLRARLGDPGTVRSWSEWVEWSKEQLERWFGPRGLDRLDGNEKVAWEQTQRVLDRLHHLDTIGRPVTRAEFRSTFVAELEITPGRHGKVGDGVHVSSISGASGLDVDMVTIVGGADGLLPPPPAIDPLLGDHERRRAGLVTSDERAASVHRQFLAAAGTTSSVVVTVPRGDLRATAVHHPSRWITALTATSPGRVSTRIVASHAEGLASTEFPVSAAEHRVRALWTQVRAGDDVRLLPLAIGDPVLARALRLRDARADDAFTEYDGNLSSRTMPPLEQPVSPSRIELWARCPYAYFVQYVLRVRPIEEPEAIESLTALDRGSAIHDAIDRLQRAVLEGRVVAPGSDGWTDEHAAVLRHAGEAVADELHDAGRTGRMAHWANHRTLLLDDLDRWMAFDREDWHGRSIRSSEQAFGADGNVHLVLPGGRAIAFAGAIDRVDELPDGTIVVTDHKTGKAKELDKLSALDPTLGATRFQLPVYAAAARHLLGRPDAPVHAEYAFFKPQFKRVGVAFDDAVWEQVGRDLARVVDGIEAGIFPAVPAPPTYQHYVGCWFCEPDALGTAVPWAEFERKRRDPRLERWFAVAETAVGAS